MSFSDDLEDQSYEIKDELKIRKVLENHTDWQFEFSKNDKFAYDLEITEWDKQPRDDSSSRVLGYVELERARHDRSCSWVSDQTVPDEWVFYSFLQRKVRDYDHQRRCWTGLKDDWERTVYLKFNHALTSCFAASIVDIHQHGRQTPRSDGSYNDTYLALDLESPHVVTGISDSVAFIEEYLHRTEPDQSSLLSFGGKTA